MKDIEIDNIPVTEMDIGAKVIYVPRHAKGDASHNDCEGGIIKRWNESGVFITYSTGNTKHTPPELLTWG